MNLPSTPPISPKYLFKYVGTADHHFAIIENLEIRFSQPSALNDPLDCQPEVVGPEDPKATVEQIIQRNVARHPGRWTDQQIDGARARFLRSYTTDVDQRIQESAAALRRNLDMLGVLSLADTADSLVMWAHYAEGHRGFVIEFDTQFAPLIQRPAERGWQGLPAPVTYQPRRPEVYCDSLNLQLPDELVLIKTSAWSYEREWRVVRDRANADRTISPSGTEVSLFSIDPQAISAVYLGKDATSTTEQRIRKALASNSNLQHVRVARGSISAQGAVVFS